MGRNSDGKRRIFFFLENLLECSAFLRYNNGPFSGRRMPKYHASDPSAYATVAELIEQFYATHPLGRIKTQLISRTKGETVFKASVFRAPDETAPAATGWAAEREGDGEVNTFACVENTETSAVGRALANLGFTASAKRPSREEMERVQRLKNQNITTQRRASHEVENRQQIADALFDLIELLNEAQSSGFPSARSQVIRHHLKSTTLDEIPRIRRIETRVRNWIHRHDM